MGGSVHRLGLGGKGRFPIMSSGIYGRFKQVR